MIINYNGKKVELDYSEKYVEQIKYPIKVTGYSSGKYENYYEVEKEALEYLVKHARERKNSKYTLNSIKGITQTTKEVVFNKKYGVKIELEGFAVFQRNE